MRTEKEICMVCNHKQCFAEYKWGILELCKKCFQQMRVREQIQTQERRTLAK